MALHKSQKLCYYLYYMRLRTYESFWLLKNGLLYTYPSLQKNLSAEVIVIGGGITGALISHALVQAGYQTILMDKRDIASGSTSATTSMLQYEIDEPLYKLAKKIGEDAAAACYQAGIDAIKELEQLIEKENIDCGFARKGSLYFAHSNRASKWLKKEFEIRQKHKLGVKWLNATDIKKMYGLHCFGGILSDVAASIDAYKLAHALIRKNVKRGLQVYDQVEIKKFEYGNRQVTVSLENGCTVKGKKIVFCTGFEAVEMIGEPIANLHSTFACVSEENIKLHANLQKLLMWNTNDPYLYMRTTDDGRLLAGGGDSPYKSARFMDNEKVRKSTVIIRQLKKLIPAIDFIEDFNWAGVFGTTKDGLPYIGEHPRFKNAIFVLGFGGNGITFSVQGMKIITDILKEKINPLAAYYRFNR